MSKFFVVALLVGIGALTATLMPKNPTVHYQVEFAGFTYGHGDATAKIGWLCSDQLDGQYHANTIAWSVQPVFSGDDRLGFNTTPKGKCRVRVLLDGQDLKAEIQPKEGEHKFILVSPGQVTFTSLLAK